MKFTLHSEAEHTFGQKHVAYITGPGRSEINRHHCYRMRFNDNPDYPVFEILEALETCPDASKTRFCEGFTVVFISCPDCRQRERS